MLITKERALFIDIYQLLATKVGRKKMGTQAAKLVATVVPLFAATPRRHLSGCRLWGIRVNRA
jgi:hypothetical protein